MKSKPALFIITSYHATSLQKEQIIKNADPRLNTYTHRPIKQKLNTNHSSSALFAPGITTPGEEWKDVDYSEIAASFMGKKQK